MKNTVIISDIRTGIKMLPQPRALIHNDCMSMVGECCRHQLHIEPAAAPANFTAKTHSCDQRLSVTNDFFCLAEARSLVTGSTVQGLRLAIPIYDIDMMQFLSIKLYGNLQ